MGWFANLFRPFEPPTERQLRFAEALGISVTSRMSKQDVSQAIDQKKAADPRQYGKASGAIRRGSDRASAVANHSDRSSLSDSNAAWLKTDEGKEAVAAFKKWAKIVESEPYGIFIYRSPKTGRVEVDVAQLSEVDCDHNAQAQTRVVVSVSLPKVQQERGDAKRLHWIDDLGWFPVSNILLWEKLPASFADVDGCAVDHNADSDDKRWLKRYEAAVAKGTQLARQNRFR